MFEGVFLGEHVTWQVYQKKHPPPPQSSIHNLHNLHNVHNFQILATWLNVDTTSKFCRTSPFRLFRREIAEFPLCLIFQTQGRILFAQSKSQARGVGVFVGTAFGISKSFLWRVMCFISLTCVSRKWVAGSSIQQRGMRKKPDKRNVRMAGQAPHRPGGRRKASSPGAGGGERWAPKGRLGPGDERPLTIFFKKNYFFSI